MARLDDATIMRYVDGELDQREAAEIERLLAEDPDARARAAMFRETRQLLRSAFEEEPGSTPQRLVDAARGASGTAPTPAARRRGAPRWLLPLAASVAIFVIGGLAGSEIRSRISEPTAAGLQAHALSEIAKSYKVFAIDGPRTVELGPDQRPLIERWFTRRLMRAVTMPDLSRHGLAFGGGRLMAVEEGPVALAVYYTADKKPIGLCITPWQGHEVLPKPDKRGDTNIVYWTSAGYLQVLIGQADPGFLMRLVEDAGQALSKPLPADKRS